MVKKQTVSSEQLYEYIAELSKLIDSKKYTNIYGVPRGGVPIAYLLSNFLQLPVSDKVDRNTLVVDDLVDSGRTLRQFENDTATIFIKPHSPKPTYFVEETDKWIEFYYEDTASDIESNIVRILEFLGENPEREGLLETPKRYIKFLQQFTSPDEYNFTTFDSENYDEMIIQKDIPFFSLCEHHLAPFFGHAHVAYIPNNKIVGLSKLTRTVEWYSRRLQNQERITTQIAERLQQELSPHGVAVTLSARHFCMEMRGVKTHDVHTTTSKLLGYFKDLPEARSEYLSLIK